MYRYSIIKEIYYFEEAPPEILRLTFLEQENKKEIPKYRIPENFFVYWTMTGQAKKSPSIFPGVLSRSNSART